MSTEGEDASLWESGSEAVPDEEEVPRARIRNVDPAEIRRLVDESREANKGEFLLTGVEVKRSINRFRRMRELVKEGKTEEARSVWWWPRNEDPPKKHYFLSAVKGCSCQGHGSRGSDGLCKYCRNRI